MNSFANFCLVLILAFPCAVQVKLIATHLREHGQFFGKVNDTGDGGSDDLGELAEGLQVHLVSV